MGGGGGGGAYENMGVTEHGTSALLQSIIKYSKFLIFFFGSCYMYVHIYVKLQY